MKIQTIIKNDGRHHERFSPEIFSDLAKQAVGKPVRTPHTSRRGIVWLDTGIVSSCVIMERFRYDCMRLDCEIRVPKAELRPIVGWKLTLQIEDIQLIAVKITPTVVDAVVFHNDNPVPGT